MKKGAGKNKGGAFERAVCKQLSLWVSKGKRTDLFWRTAGSGSRATVMKQSTHAGDIAATLPEGHILTDVFVIECKFYRNLRLESLLTDKPAGILPAAWEKLEQQARKLSKLPLLIAKQNNTKTLILTRYQTCVLPNVKLVWLSAYVSSFDRLLSEVDFNECIGHIRSSLERQS